MSSFCRNPMGQRKPAVRRGGRAVTARPRPRRRWGRPWSSCPARHRACAATRTGERLYNKDGRHGVAIIGRVGIMDNRTIEHRLRQHAKELENEGGNLYRVRAYRQAANMVSLMEEPLEQIWAVRGRRGLRA